MTAHAPRPAERKRASALEAAGLTPQRAVHWNLGPPELYEHAVRRAEGVIAEGGAFAAVTAPHTGRSPNDKFIVREPASADEMWWNRGNQPLEADAFERLKASLLAHLAEQELFVRDLFAGADVEHRFGLRFVTPNAWHALFVYNMFLRPSAADLAAFTPVWTVHHAPEFHADPAIHGTKSGTFMVIHFSQRTILIGGTRYAGEMKKSVFTILNYLLPKRGVLSMHCSANLGRAGDVALFFGLSGTGKTTLSADPERALIGDDEHGWSDRGIFNFEGGCYAKVIRLSREGEPEIFATTHMFGTVLENVVVDPDTRAIDLDSDRITENTRASYPIHYIPNHVPGGAGGHPSHILFLTCDAYGIMPPIARLSPAQAMYHFLSGYTAKVAGTERGVTEPKATFSTCFGAPFLPLQPNVYASLLGEKIATHGVQCWLVNTGWTGGPYGVGQRIRLGPEALAVVATPAVQRLRYVRQLGHAFLVYPGATHSRFEHALGAYHLARRALSQLEAAGDLRLDPADRVRLKLAALLHDIGHYPFSHSLEEAGLPHHEELAGRHLADGELAQRLVELGIPSQRLLPLIQCRAREPLAGLVSGSLDVDKLDYLSRDAWMCGVPYGVIDVDRLLTSLTLAPGGDGHPTLALHEKGLAALESLLFAKYQMYRNVYWHHAVRSATSMFKRLVRRAIAGGRVRPDAVAVATDDGLIHELLQQDVTGLARSLRERRLAKRALDLAATELPADTPSWPSDDPDLLERVEDRLARDLRLVPGELFLDFPAKTAMLSLGLPLVKRDGTVTQLGGGEAAAHLGLPRVAPELYRSARRLRVFVMATAQVPERAMVELVMLPREEVVNLLEKERSLV